MSSNISEDMDSKKQDTGAGIEVAAKIPEAAAAAPSIEMSEEAKLKLKYSNMNRPMAGHSAFLQKRLAKGQKYFDSGDYQMAKQKTGNKSRITLLSGQPTGDAIPTPESVPVRKTSIIQYNKLTAS